MKTLLYRAGLFDVDALDLPVVLLGYLCKVLMIVAIAFLVFLLTSGNYSGASFLQNERENSEVLKVTPPAPF